MKLVNNAKYSGFMKGVRTAFGVAGFVMFASFLGFGALIYAAGIPIELGILTVFFIWALPAQVLLVSLYIQNANMFAILLAVAMSSIRLIPMVVAVMVLARNKKLPAIFNYIAIHYIAATIWILCNKYLAEIKPKRRLMFVVGLGTTLITIMTMTTYLGYHFAMTMNPIIVMSLIFLTPSFFLLSLFISVNNLKDYLPIILPIMITFIISFYNAELDIIVGGLVGGVLAYIIDRFIRDAKGKKIETVSDE